MEFAWHPIGVIGLVSGAIALGLAILVLRATPRRSVNLRLGALLTGEALAISTGFGFVLLMVHREDALSWYRAHSLVVTVMPLLYLVFLASLDTPLVRPLRSAWLYVPAGILTTAVLAYALARPDFFVMGMEASEAVRWQSELSEAAQPIMLANALIPLYGFAAAVSAWWRAAPGSLTRARGRIVAIAFGTRDILFFIAIGAAIVAGEAGVRILHIVLPAALIFYLSLLAYGILSNHVFDIDLKIRRTLKRTTVIAIFALAFFAVSETAEAFVSQTLGNTLGLAVAALLTLGLRSLDRFAERIASLAMPNVNDTDDYLRSRRLQVYRAAYEGALEDGVFTSMERRLLDRLASELNLTPAEARSVEDDVAQKMTPPVAEAT